MVQSDQQPNLPILDDAEWTLFQALEERAREPLGVAAEEAVIAEAAARTGFDLARLQAALATLIEKQVLARFGEGAVEITALGRQLIVARRR